MKFLFSLVMAVCLSPLAHAFSKDAGYKAEFQFNQGAGFQISKLGTKIIRDTYHDVVVQYDFSKDGGAITTNTKLRSPASAGSSGFTSATLPKGAIVTGCFIDVITALTTSASGTVALSTGQAAADLKTATAAASYTGIVACVPVQTAGTAIKLTADSNPYYAIATGAITAGKFNLHIQYVMSDM